MKQSRADEVRRALEGLKSFDVVHELRMINMEKEMDCPGTGDSQDMIIEKFKAFHENLFSVIEGLFGMVADLETKCDALEKQLSGFLEEPLLPRIEAESELVPFRSVNVGV